MISSRLEIFKTLIEFKIFYQPHHRSDHDDGGSILVCTSQAKLSRFNHCARPLDLADGDALVTQRLSPKYLQMVLSISSPAVESSLSGRARSIIRISRPRKITTSGNRAFCLRLSFFQIQCFCLPACLSVCLSV